MNIIKKHSDRYIINNFKTFDFLILSYIKTINYWIFMERVNVIKEFWQYTYIDRLNTLLFRFRLLEYYSFLTVNYVSNTFWTIEATFFSNITFKFILYLYLCILPILISKIRVITSYFTFLYINKFIARPSHNNSQIINNKNN